MCQAKTNPVCPITGAGIQMNRQGYALYGSFGLLDKGGGASMIFSQSDIKSHSTSASGTHITKKGVVFNLNIDESGDRELSTGLGTPGDSLMINHTFSFHEWGDSSGYKFIQSVE